MGIRTRKRVGREGCYVLVEEKHTTGILPGSLPPSGTVQLSATPATVCHNVGSGTKPCGWHSLKISQELSINALSRFPKAAICRPQRSEKPFVTIRP